MSRCCGFSVGFGRTLWRKQRGETEWVIGALPLGGYVRMLDEREGPVDAAEFATAPSTANPCCSAPPWWRLARSRIWCWPCCCYTVAHWIGTDEPRAVISAPSADSVAARAGLASGDWIRTLAEGEASPRVVQSMNDLRWLLTRAALSGRDATVTVSDAEGARRAQRRAAAGQPWMRWMPTRSLMKRIGITSPYSPAVIGDCRGGRGRLSSRGCAKAIPLSRSTMWRCRDAATLRARIRSSGESALAGGRVEAQRWTVRRGVETDRSDRFSRH